MNYWLVCLPREDLLHCIKHGVFGLARRNVIGKVKKGDKVVCCSGKGDWKVLALGKASSDYYVDDEKIFLKEGSFLDRFALDAELLRQELELLSIVDKLSVVTN